MLNRPLYFVVNPRAGQGKCHRFANDLERIFNEKNLHGDTHFIETDRDPSVRVSLIVKEIVRTRGDNPILVGLGGDGTTAILAEAHLAAKKLGCSSVVIPGGGGTAGDLRRELGAPNWRGDAESYARSLMHFISVAQPIDMNAFRAEFDGGARTIIHSLGLGFSGGLFDEVDKERERGMVGVTTYLKLLFLRLFKTSSFYVSVNEGDPLQAGEVVMLANSTIMGSVASLPLRPNTARVHVVPADLSCLLATGVAPLMETFVRSALYYVGFSGAIGHDSRLWFLGRNRMFDLGRDSSLNLRFTDKVGKSKMVMGIANGDSLRTQLDSINIRWIDTISSLALLGSRYLYRHSC